MIVRYYSTISISLQSVNLVLVRVSHLSPRSIQKSFQHVSLTILYRSLMLIGLGMVLYVPVHYYKSLSKALVIQNADGGLLSLIRKYKKITCGADMICLSLALIEWHKVYNTICPSRATLIGVEHIFKLRFKVFETRASEQCLIGPYMRSVSVRQKRSEWLAKVES